MKVTAWSYRQFSADFEREVPEHGYGGWEKIEIELPLERTALVSMHAWAFDPADSYPGLLRAAPYLSRSERILREVYPPLLSAVRRLGMPVIHVVGGSGYYEEEPGYLRTVELAGDAPDELSRAPEDPVAEDLKQLRRDIVYPGAVNQEDCGEAHKNVRFPHAAKPVSGEMVAKDAHQLNAACRELGVSHLIYVGFAINWCLLMSPGGMLDMSRRGYLCSTVRQATTAVESKEAAGDELCKDIALWRVAVAFGFVFDSEDLIAACERGRG